MIRRLLARLIPGRTARQPRVYGPDQHDVRRDRLTHGLGLRIPHPEGFDHPNLLIVLGAATLGSTRLIDNVDVVRKDGED